MTYLLLGCRLALAGGRLRAGLVVAGNAVGVVVLLLAAAVPASLPSGLSADDRRFAAVVTLFLMLPVVSLLASVTRLSAGVRDRRLAALRLLGVGAASTRLVATTEALALSAAGVVAGALAWVVAVRPAVEALDASWRSWFDGRDLAPAATGWLVAVAGVPLLAAVVALAPVHGLTRSGLGVRRQASARRPGAWRLAPLAAGLGLLGWAASRTQTVDTAVPPHLVVTFFAGTALVAVSLPLVVPVLVRLVADAGIRLGRHPATLVAARRLQQEPAGSTRLVAALLVAVFAVAGGRCVLTSFEETPQYRRALLASTSGPQRIDVGDTVGVPLDPARLRALPGVRAVIPSYDLVVECREAGPPHSYCGTVFVGTCAGLAAATYGVPGCRDDQPAWIDSGYDLGFEVPRAPTLMVLGPYGEQPSARSRLPEVTTTLRAETRRDDPNWSAGATLFVPRGTPALAPLLPPAASRWTVIADGGDAPVEAVRQAVAGTRAHVMGEHLEDLDVVAGYRAVLYAVTAVVLTVGLSALLVAGIDRAMERRRHLAALAVVGVPARVVRRSQLLQAVVPLLVGLPLAGGTGLLAGTAYLTVAGARAATPWPAVLALSVVAVVAGTLVSAATVAGLGGRVRPADLRRE